MRPWQITSPACTKLVNLCLAVLVFTGTAISASDTQNWQPKLNTHYKQLKAPADQTEQAVILYCWQGSPSCYQLESALQNWSENSGLPVANKPVIKRPDWRLLAKARLVAELMQQETLVVDAIYQRLHQEGQVINTDEQLFMLIESLGISASRFANLFYSPEVNTSLKEHELAAEQLGVAGIPTLIVNNRWLIDASMLSTSRQFLMTLDYLLASNTP